MKTNKFKWVEGYPVGKPALPEGAAWSYQSTKTEEVRIALDPDGRLVSLHLLRAGASYPDPNRPGFTFPVSSLYWEVRPIIQLEYEDESKGETQ